MITVNCSLCGSSANKILQKFGEYKIVSCNDCGFVFTATRDRKSLKSLYREEYFHIEDSRQKKRGYRSYEKDRDHHLYYFEKKMLLIKNFISKGKILDVGCALGFFMEAAKKKGFDPYGVDISDYAISYALKKFPNTVFLNTLMGARLERGSFDCLTMFQTIEHLNNPLENLKEANRVLKKNGIVVIATPNYDCLIRKLMGNYWFEYKPEEHLNFFDKRTIKLLLEKSGFRLMFFGSDMFFYPIGYILERFLYYTPISVLKKIFGPFYKVFDNLPVKNVRIPLPLGGMIVVAQKT